jgi:hypothetical protein
MKIVQKRRKPLIGFYLYCLQGMLLSTLSFLILQTLFDTEYDRADKIYQLLRHLLYLPLLILILYSFKSIVKIKTRLLFHNIMAFMLFGGLLFYLGRMDLIKYDLLFFFSFPLFLYSYNRLVLKKFIRGYPLLHLLLHYLIFFFILLASITLMMPIVADTYRYTYIEHLYRIGSEDTGETYATNPALILLVAMVIFISSQRIKRSPKERFILFLLVGILYTFLYYGIIQYSNS